MRRLAAILTLMSVAHVTVLRAEPACARTAEVPPIELTTAHAHHAPPAADHASHGQDDAHDSAPRHCLTMTHCLSSVALAAEPAPGLPPAPAQVIGMPSIHLPRASGTAPELPPPRA